MSGIGWVELVLHVHAKVRFCNLLRIREKLNPGGNRCNYPFYIYKIFEEILEGEQRWVLSYIHVQSEKTRKNYDKNYDIEWRKKKEELEKGISDGPKIPTRQPQP